MAKKERANVFRRYLPNLRRFWIVKLPFVTLCGVWTKPGPRPMGINGAYIYRREVALSPS